MGTITRGELLVLETRGAGFNSQVPNHGGTSSTGEDTAVSLASDCRSVNATAFSSPALFADVPSVGSYLAKVACGRFDPDHPLDCRSNRLVRCQPSKLY